MSKVNDGGNAFPLSVHPGHGYGPKASTEPGMTLRDWFAGQALIGLLANPGMIDQHATSSIDWVSYHSYLQADAMLAEREKGGSK